MAAGQAPAGLAAGPVTDADDHDVATAQALSMLASSDGACLGAASSVGCTGLAMVTLRVLDRYRILDRQRVQVGAKAIPTDLNTLPLETLVSHEVGPSSSWALRALRVAQGHVHRRGFPREHVAQLGGRRSRGTRRTETTCTPHNQRVRVAQRARRPAVHERRQRVADERELLEIGPPDEAMRVPR